jgi:uncharacterized membrane protein YkvA (DUF1232 family)
MKLVIIALIVIVAAVLCGWLLLAFAARRIGRDLVRDLAKEIPAHARTVARLARDSRVPKRAKVALLVMAAWVAFPIDLIPEFIPVIGPLDDVIVIALALWYAGKHVPPDVLTDVWAADPQLLERVRAARANG